MTRTRAIALTISTLILFALTYPMYQAVGDGLDPSWQTGLFLGVHNGLVFGRDVVYTYGPLGFLKFPALYFPALTFTAWAYVAAVRMATSLLLVIAAHRIFRSHLIAVVTALVGTLAIELPEIWEIGYAAPVTVAVFVWAALAVEDGPDSSAYRVIPIVGGALCAVEVLSKTTIGIMVPSLFVYVILAVGRRRLRDLAVFGVVLLAVLPILLAAAGQPIGAFGEYLQRAREVAAGYAASRGEALTTRDWLYAACPLILLLVASFAVVPRAHGWKRGVLPGLLLLYAFQVYKAGIISGHTAVSYTSMLGAWFGIPWRRVPLTAPLAKSLVALCVLAIVLFTTSLATGTPLAELLGVGRPPLSNWRAETGAMLQLFQQPEILRREIDRTRDNLRREYAIAPALIAAIGQHPVHIDPWETSVAWAYGLNWRPAPVFQAYLAESAPLDQMNARAFESASGPTIILRQIAPPPLGRHPSFESPAAVVAMLCNFQHVAGEGMWEVLRRTSNRCGGAEEIGSSNGRYGDVVHVPQRPGSLVAARIEGVRDGILGQLRNTFYRARARTITVDTRTARLVANTAEDGLLMHVPATADYPGSFRISPDAMTLMVDDEGHSRRPIRIVFYARAISGT